MINRFLNHLEEWLIACLMAAATLLIFAAVVHRYASGIPHLQDYALKINMSWAQELCIYMFVWMAKFGAAYGVREGVHVGVDVLVARLPEDWRKKGVYVALFGGVVFTAVIGTMGAKFVWENGAHYAFLHALGMDTGDLPEGPTTPDLEWPTWFIYSAVPLGSFLMCFRFVQVAIKFWQTGEMPKHDESKVEGLEDVADDPNLIPGLGKEANLKGAR